MKRLITQEYIYESTAKKLKPKPKSIPKQTKKPVFHHYDYAEDKKINLRYIIFLTCAILVSSFILIYYIEIQSEVLGKLKTISVLESELNSLKIENANKMAEIQNNINLNEIKQIAISELGMRYPDESQIIYYKNNNSDYVRQYGDIP